MRIAHVLSTGLVFCIPAAAKAQASDVVMAPGTYSGDQTHAGRTIVRNGTVFLNNGRFTNSPVVIVEDTGILAVRSFLNPVFPNVLEMRGGVIREREALGVNVLRLGSGTSEAEFEGHPFNITRLERNPGATIVIDPSGPINPATGRAFRITNAPPGVVGGGGGGATRLAVAPWAVAVGNATERTFATYEGDVLRGLDPATEYASAFSASPGANVRLAADTAAPANVSVNSLTINGSTLTLGGGALTLDSGGLMFNPAATNSGGITGSGSLVLPAEGFVHAYRARLPVNPPAATYTIDVPVSGGMLTKTGTGTLVLTKSNTHAGGTTVNEGSLVAATPASLGSGPIRMAGGTVTIESGSLVPNDIILQSNTTPPTGRNFLTSGPVVLGGRVSGDGVVVLNNPARLTGGGAGTGAYEVRGNGGPLTIDGDLASPDSVVVTGALFGRGAARGVVSAGATTSPGEQDNGVGRLTVGDGYFGGANSLMQFDLAGPGAGSGYDQLVALDSLQLDRQFRASNAAPLPELFVRMAGNYAPSPGEQFTIIDNRFAGPVGGTFEFRPEGAEFFAGLTPFRISYAGGDGNDVVLTVVPEPGAAAALLLPAMASLLRRRRGADDRVY